MVYAWLYFLFHVGFCLFIFSFSLFCLVDGCPSYPCGSCRAGPQLFHHHYFFFSSHLFSWAAWLGGRVFQLYCGWEKCVDVLLIPKDIRDGMALHGLSRCPKDTPNSSVYISIHT
ncbi:hypothetical protein V8C40DRAFT_73824 [Trichoderma camerunense]